MVFKNILTFGAAGRIERKVDDFEDLKSEYEECYRRMEASKDRVTSQLNQVILVKKEAVQKLARIEKLSKKIKMKARNVANEEFEEDFRSVDFGRIEKTVTAGQMALNATKGVAAGVGTAAGAWALASGVGVASTGTAISALSGAAAFNATAAWLGGGALAAGGGGMAAGAAVMGGLVAIPALAVMGAFSHIQANKKIGEIEKQMTKILSHIDQIENNILQLKLIGNRSQELIVSVGKATEVFSEELLKVERELRGPLYIGVIIRFVRSRIFRGEEYTTSEVEKIAYIGKIGTSLAELIDTPIFEEGA